MLDFIVMQMSKVNREKGYGNVQKLPQPLFQPHLQCSGVAGDLRRIYEHYVLSAVTRENSCSCAVNIQRMRIRED